MNNLTLSFYSLCTKIGGEVFFHNPVTLKCSSKGFFAEFVAIILCFEKKEKRYKFIFCETCLILIRVSAKLDLMVMMHQELPSHPLLGS